MSTISAAILNICIESELKKLEAKWIEKLQPLGDDCYNTNLNIRNFTY